MFTENTERVIVQQKADIRVIVGNPPYSVGQDSANDNNQNQKYPSLDARIASTYVASTKATNKNSLYDSYIRAFRWASDRIGDAGIVCFVSNGGWLRGNAFDGFRKSLAAEFNSIYVYNLRGNQRAANWREEGGKVFDAGAQVPVAIAMLVKNPASTEHGAIRYFQSADFAKREEKLRTLTDVIPADPEWSAIVPNDHGDWLDQRDGSFNDFAPMGLEKRKAPLGMWEIWSRGIATGRDDWSWSFKRQTAMDSMKKTIAFYECERARMGKESRGGDPAKWVKYDEKGIKWNRSLFIHLSRNEEIAYNANYLVLGTYRPFCKQWVYYDPKLIERTYQQPRLFPLAGGERAKGPTSNPIVTSVAKARSTGEVKGKGGEMTYQQSPSPCLEKLVITLTQSNRRAFTCFVTDTLPDLHMDPDGAQCFPLYWYEEDESSDSVGVSGFDSLIPAQGSLFGGEQASLAETASDEFSRWVRHDAITDTALAVFREAYPELAERITKREIFFYVYGVLHSPEYRERFANNLKKELPRIPLVRNFDAFRKAGHRLADLHLHYEDVPAWAGLVEDGDSKNPGRTEKMTWGKAKDPETGKAVKDYTVLNVAENLTIRNIPERAQGYVVGGRSPLEWLVDRFKVTTDKKSGIVNDPNLYSRKQRYIVDLVESVIRVSMETLDIVESLPPLDELPQTANWPAEWKA